MQGENSPELSLRDKVLAAREQSKAKVMEKDAAREADKAAKKAERDRKREERERKFKETVAKSKQKVSDFRAWDKQSTLNLYGEIGAAPKIAEIGVKTGVEVSKKFAVDRKDEVVETAKKVGEWVEDRGMEIKVTAIATAESVQRTVNKGVENTVQAYNQTKEDIANAYLETKSYANEQVKKGKESLIKTWRRIQAVPEEIKADIYKKKEARLGEKIDQYIGKYAEVSSKKNECLNRVAELKGTRNSLAKEFATA